MNKNLIIITICFLSLQSIALQAQKTHFSDKWIMGAYGQFQLNFTPSAVADSFKNNNLDTQLFAAHSGICDSNGRLLLLCNGYTLFDSNGSVVQGGAQLVSSSYFNTNNQTSGQDQSSIILPMDSGLYYVIVQNVTDWRLAQWNNSFLDLDVFDELILYKVDIKGNNGLPRVIDTTYLTQNDSLNNSMMMACKHNNGKDWWLIKPTRIHAGFTDPLFTALPWPAAKNRVAKIFIGRDSLSAPNYQDFPNSYISHNSSAGQIGFSCDGSKFALTSYQLNKLFIADFDRSTAQFSNPQFIDVPILPRQSPFNPNLMDSTTVGVCFSPNSQFIYVTKDYNIVQYDLLESDPSKQWYHVAGIDSTWQFFTGYGNMNLGADNKLYVGNRGAIAREISYINHPSRKGAACDFRKRGLDFSHAPFGAVSRPPTQPYYDMDLVPCDTSIDRGEPNALPQWSVENIKLKLFPNPTDGFINIEIEGGLTSYQYQLVSITGRQIQKGVLKSQLDISDLQSGMYLLSIYNQQAQIVRKVWVQ